MRNATAEVAICLQRETISTMHTIMTISTMGETTTISLSRETKELLREFGQKGETYDEIVRHLIERASIKELDERWNRILREEKFIPLDKL